MNKTNDQSNHRKSLTKPALLAAAVAALVPLTAFAGIGAWNGVQRVMLGTAIELGPTEPSASSAAASPAAPAWEESRSSRTSDKAGFLGVSTTRLTNQLRDRFGVPTGQGVMVSEVTDNSAAYFAGLEAGDVITAVDSVEIEDQGDLSRAIRRAGADNSVTLEIYRDGRSQVLDATLQAASDRRASVSWSSDRNDDRDHDWDNTWSADEMEEFAERMAEFGERFGTEFGETWAEEFAENAEAFGERMAEWGEDFGRRMEERFENEDWKGRSFHFSHDGDFDEAELEEVMERLHVELENLDLAGLGALVENALAGVDFEAIGAEVEAAIEQAMEGLENNR